MDHNDDKNISKPNCSTYIDNGFGNCSNLFWFAVTAVVLGGAFQHGYSMAVVANTIPMFQHKFNSSDLYISAIVSGMAAGGLAGALLAGYFADKLGRKNAIILNSLPLVIGWCLMAAAPYDYRQILLVGRIVTGFGVGAGSGLTNIFLSEISPVKIRGFIGTLYGIFLSIGSLVALLLSMPSVIGDTDNGFRLVFAFPILFVLLQVAILLACPEPPSYLALLKHDIRAATNSLSQYRKVRVKEEEDELKHGDAQKYQYELTFTDLIRDSGHRLALIIGIILHCSQQLSGITAVISYTPAIFEEANVADPALATVWTGLVNVFAGIAAALISDRIGRRSLLIGGVIVLILAQTGLAVSQACNMNTTWSCKGDWTGDIAMASVLTYIAGFAASLGSVIWLYVSEITAAEARGKSTSVCISVNWGLALVVMFAYDSVEKAIRPYTFFLFASILTVCLILVIFLMPETRKKNVKLVTEEIKKQAANFPPTVFFG